ncbi:MAG: hypothetical protein C4334_14465 [Pyrinomonas sp.]|uniref:VWA domain-containing protein n=1 Tax=Pyrinomonas sp. TaxID=2080306 RepID=UPI0033251D32
MNAAPPFCRCLCSIVCTAALFAQTVVAQQAPVDPARQTRPRRVSPPVSGSESLEEVIRVETDLVLVDVTVTDHQGLPVRGLRAEDFRIYDDGEERPVAFFNVEQRTGGVRPVAVVFALDVSGSMRADEMLRLRQALEAFARSMAGRPFTYAVMSFGMRVKVLQNFTDDPRRFERVFAQLARDVNGLSTHAYDAVDDAIRLLARHAPRTRSGIPVKRAVVLVTDGFPVGDTISPQTVIERANAADVSVYSVTLPSYSRFVSAASMRAPLPTPLDVSGLVEMTGGRNFYATEDDFDSLFRAMAEEINAAYALAFYPPEQKRRDGLFHTVRIEGPRGLRLRQSRTGYRFDPATKRLVQ